MNGRRGRCKGMLSFALAASVTMLASAPLCAQNESSLKKSSVKSSSVSGDTRKQLARFEAELEALRNLLMIPGLSAAVVKDQKLIWARGFGLADNESRRPATEETPYRIASLTKTFASTLIMQLVEEGKLSLDEPMSKYSPDFKDDSVRVRHILSHTSEGVPGAKYKYNGDRFAYLDAVIEKISGKTFRELLTEKILAQLSMTESVPGQDVLETPNKLKDKLDAKTLQRYEKILGELAKPYALYGDHEIILSPYPLKRITTAADFISTVVDLAKYDIAIDRHLLLKKETQNAAWTPTVSNDGQTLPYGLGWFVQSYQGLKLIWHSGQWPNFSALYLKVPEKNLTLILLANSGALSTPFGLGAGDVTKSPFALTFLRMFAFAEAQAASSDIRERESQARQVINDWRSRRRARVRKEVTVEPKILDAYVGEYELLPRPIVITREGDKLMAEGPGQPKVEIFAASETEFFLKVVDADITFVKDETGKVTHLMLKLYGQQFRAEKLK